MDRSTVVVAQTETVTRWAGACAYTMYMGQGMPGMGRGW